MRDDIVLRRGIGRIEADRIRIGQETDVAFAELAVRAGQVKIPVKLLADGVDHDRVLVLGKLIYSLGPKRDREADEQNGFDQDNGKFQVRGDAALDALVVRDRMPALAEAHQDVNEKDRPADKQRGHEPMAELDDVIDLVAVLGSIRRQADQFVEEGEPIHISPDPRPSIPGAARAACWRAAKDGN